MPTTGDTTAAVDVDAAVTDGVTSALLAVATIAVAAVDTVGAAVEPVTVTDAAGELVPVLDDDAVDEGAVIVFTVAALTVFELDLAALDAVTWLAAVPEVAPSAVVSAVAADVLDAGWVAALLVWVGDGAVPVPAAADVPVDEEVSAAAEEVDAVEDEAADVDEEVADVESLPVV